MRGRSTRRPMMGKKACAAKLGRLVQSAGTGLDAEQKAIFRERMVAAKANHDALEAACVQYAQVKHKVRMMKSDSESSFGKNGKLQARRVTSGMPDRIAVIPPTGRFAGFEFKTGKAYLKPNQKELHAQMSAAGAATFVIHSIDEFIETLDGLIQIEKEKFNQISRGEQHTPPELAFSNQDTEGADLHQSIE